jgi:hypothetical protein
VITGTSHGGVEFVGGGAVTNNSGGTISGANFGVYVGGGTAATNTLTNTGWIYGTGTNSVGVNLGSGGTVTNQKGGTVNGGGAGVYIKGRAGALINAGGIDGTAASGMGAVLKDGGTVTNTGKITGGSLGVHIAGGGTVDNKGGGTISGANFGVTIGGGAAATNTLTNSGAGSTARGQTARASISA